MNKPEIAKRHKETVSSLPGFGCHCCKWKRDKLLATLHNIIAILKQRITGKPCKVVLNWREHYLYIGEKNQINQKSF